MDSPIGKALVRLICASLHAAHSLCVGRVHKLLSTPRRNLTLFGSIPDCNSLVETRPTKFTGGTDFDLKTLQRAVGTGSALMFSIGSATRVYAAALKLLFRDGSGLCKPSTDSSTDSTAKTIYTEDVTEPVSHVRHCLALEASSWDR